MKRMKVHKIRNVEKSECFAEQKIAYNYAFSWRSQLEQIEKANVAESVKSAKRQNIIDCVVRGIKEQKIDEKYNIDAIIHCFRNGMEEYLKGFSILTSYKEIGNIFKCSYEIY